MANDFIPAEQLLGLTQPTGIKERVQSAFGVGAFGVKSPAAPTGFKSAEELLGIPAFETEARKGPSFWDSIKNVWASPLQAPAAEPTTKPDFASAAPGEMMYAETPGGAATGRAKARGTARTGFTVEGDVTELPAIALGTAMQASDMATSVGKQLLGAAPYWATRTYAAAKGESPKMAAAAGQEAKDYFFPPELSTPWGKVAESMGPAMQKAYNKNPIAWVMGKIGEVVTHGAEKAEASAGIPMEDIMALADQTMGSLFFKQSLKPRFQEAFAKRVEDYKAKQAAKAPEPDTSNVPQGEPLIIIDSPAQVKEMFKTAAKEGTPVAREAQWVTDIFEAAKRGEGAPTMPGALRESRFEPPKWKAEEFKMPERSGGLTEGTVIGEVPRAFDTAVEKLRTDRAPTMTAEEVLALRQNAKIDGDGLIVDPRSGKPFFQRGSIDQKQFMQFMAALGVTGAAAAAMANWYGQDAATEGAALAGIAALGITRGMPMKEVLERMPTSSKVLDRLPNRAEFTREQVAQELKRQDVTGQERELIERLVAGMPGEKISAAELGTKFQQATDTFVLERQQTPEYADYGLERIRPDMSKRENLRGLASDDITTTLHRLPFELSDANHFRDPNLFGWTRSFREDGIKHVVEIQSDLAQHAKGAVKEADRPALLEDFKKTQERIARMEQNGLTDLERRMNSLELSRLHLNELRVKLETTAADSQVGPLLKNWPRRLIREELVAEANRPARELLKQAERYPTTRSSDMSQSELAAKWEAELMRLAEESKKPPVVRFATADTVAKVEGWAQHEWNAKESPRSIEEVIDNGSPHTYETLEKAWKQGFVQPEHASIYQRYAGDITRYLKTLGGKEVTDAQGHTWIEVPTKGTGPKVQLWTRPETVATVGAATAGVLAQTDPDKLESLGIHLAGLGAAGAAAFGHIKLKGMPEGDLIRLAREGGKEGEAAFAKLYADNKKQLERSVASFERTGIDVEDVVQRSFIKAFDALKRPADAVGGFRGDSKLSTFLHRIAQNEAKNRIASAERRPQTTEVTPEIEQTAGHSDTPEKAALNTVLQQRMQQALDKLPENFRKPFEMRELEGLEYQEIADRLGIPINTVRTQIHRAKEQLQKNLGDYKNLEAGRVDPELLKLMGGAAVGGLAGYTLNSLMQGDSPIRNSIYGALTTGALATGAGRRMLKQAITSPDVTLGATSTRLRNMDVALGDQYVLHEKRVLKRVDQLHDLVTPFLTELKRLPADVKAAVDNALLNGRLDLVEQIPELKKAYPGIAKALGGLESELKGLGRFAEGVTNYFPRIVKDLEGLKQALGVEGGKGLEQVLIDAEAEMLKKKRRPMTEVEQSIVVNNYLAKTGQMSYQPGFAKGRQVEEVTPELQKFYEDPTESLLRYISGAAADIEKAKFFGKDLVNSKAGKDKSFVDTEASIGAVAARLLREGKIKQPQIAELKNILEARFVGGEQAMSQGLAAVRNLTNTGLLGNAVSAATQVGDSLATIYHFGMVPTTQAVLQKFGGKETLTAKDLGLANHVAEELSAQGITGTLQQFALTYSGFKAIDMFAKGLGLNAALLEAARQVSTPKGEAAFRARYQSTFGEGTTKLIEDLKARRLSDDMESLAFLRLSDAQPISKAEMPEAYLRHPNGRIMYQLKTYMLKQADIVRRDVYQKIASGDPKQMAVGLKNLAALGTLYALANVPGDVVKAFLNGQDIDPFSTPQLVENVMQTFGLNRYAQGRLRQGKVVDTLKDFVTPPLKVIEDVALGRPKAVSYAPLVGRIVYNRYMGGNEKKEIYENLGKPKVERKPLSPAAQAYLANKRAELKAKKAKERLQ